MQVVVVDAHDAWREAVVQHLSGLGYRVEGLHTLADMRSRLFQDLPDILILALELPDCNALHHISEIRLLNHRLGIVMLAPRRRSEDYVIGLTIGVDHYLVKPMVMAELTATLKALSRRIGSLDRAQTANTASWRFQPNTRQLTAPGGATIDLTDREGRLVSTLIHAGLNTVGRNALIMALGATPTSFDRHRLDTLIHRLRTKLRGHSPELELRNVYGLGYACVTPIHVTTEAPGVLNNCKAAS
jgi:DNA-binding response OmpR family regulator